MKKRFILNQESESLLSTLGCDEMVCIQGGQGTDASKVDPTMNTTIKDTTVTLAQWILSF